MLLVVRAGVLPGGDVMGRVGLVVNVGRRVRGGGEFFGW
jgi:hypothetical protein